MINTHTETSNLLSVYQRVFALMTTDTAVCHYQSSTTASAYQIISHKLFARLAHLKTKMLKDAKHCNDYTSFYGRNESTPGTLNKSMKTSIEQKMYGTSLITGCTTQMKPKIRVIFDYKRKRWRRVQYILNVFWQRWKAEYLQTLQTRNKWNTARRKYMRRWYCCCEGRK